MKLGLRCASAIGIVLLTACAAPSTEETNSGESDVTRAGAKAMRFVHTARLQEGDVTFCLTRHPLDKKVVKLSRCTADANTASDADTFQVVTNDPRRTGVFSFDGTKQMLVDVQAKTLSFGLPGSCTGSIACVEGGAEGLTYWDPVKHARRGVAAAMAGNGDDDLASGANNALDAHLRVADRSDLEVQEVTKPMDGLAKRCAIANGVDSCAADGNVCRLESVDHCKERCPLAAGPDLWQCMDACEHPGTSTTPYYERLGYCGPKTIQEKCLDGDPTVVACSGSDAWAGGFDCKTHAELFRCDTGQTCRNFVSAVDANGQRKSTDQLKRELCRAGR